MYEVITKQFARFLEKSGRKPPDKWTSVSRVPVRAGGIEVKPVQSSRPEAPRKSGIGREEIKAVGDRPIASEAGAQLTLASRRLALWLAALS
jgi:hypothetical protein